MWGEDLDFSGEAQKGVAPRDDTRRHILVVDDDANILRHLVRVLGVDHRVSQARDGIEALLVLRTERVDLLITDYLMPSMTGHELVDTCHAEGIACKVLIITGHGELIERAENSWWSTHRHLLKPFHFDELRAAVVDLIGPARLTSLGRSSRS